MSGQPAWTFPAVRGDSAPAPAAPLVFGAVVTPLPTASSAPPTAGDAVQPSSTPPAAAPSTEESADRPAAAPAAQPPAVSPAPANPPAPIAKDQDPSRRPEAQSPAADTDALAARWPFAPSAETNPPDRPAGRTAAPAPAAPAAPGPPPSPAPGNAPLRDIRLDLGSGEGRVEIRVADRGGEVRVAVHTPDERLAGDLRDHLASLSARLEQSGLRAETWQPGGDRWRVVEPAAASHSQSSGGHGQGRDRQPEDQPRKSKPPNSSGNEEGIDFQWLLNALR